MKGVQTGMIDPVKYTKLEAFGFGPNIMKRTRICISCGRAVDSKKTDAYYVVQGCLIILCMIIIKRCMSAVLYVIPY